MANTTVRQKSKQHVTGRANSPGVAQTHSKSAPSRGSRPTTWTGEDIKAILGGLLKSISLEKHLDAPLKSLCTDSRKCRKGDIFIALQGPNQHGLEFLFEALKAGIGAVVSDAPLPVDMTCKVPFYLVVDGQLAFRKLASEWRSRFDIPIVAVAGSVGKTTTKDLIGAALFGKFDDVLKTEGSQNGFLGIPATLSRLNPKSEAAVIEVGIDDIGAMVQHFEVVKPGVAIVTAIAPEHLERLKDIETIAAEETLLLKRTVASGGIAIINLDDEHCRNAGAALKAEQKVGYSLNPKIKLKTDMLIARQSSDGLSIEINGQVRDISFSKEKFLLPLLGRHNAGNLLGAIATAAVVGLTPDEIRGGLKAFQPEEGRSRIEQLTNGTVVICDYYNSSPASVSAALDLLKDRSIVTGARGKKYACLGDMLELGREEEHMHRRIADKLAATGVDKVLLYGERMKWLADELRRRKFESDVAHFDSHASLAEHLLERLRPDDHVLIKGSRGMAMEQVWLSLKPRT